jgi:hypothetical protein
MAMTTMDHAKIQPSHSLRELNGILHELEGEPEKEGLFTNDQRELVPSAILRRQTAIDSIHKQFKIAQQMAANMGNAVPEKMPDELQTKLYQAEADYDVTLEEIDAIKAYIDALVKQKANESNQLVLRHGPIGTGSMDNGILAEIDGQTVKPDRDGVLRIDDKRSPYNGMLVADYKRHILKPYHKELRRLREEAIEWNIKHPGEPKKEPPRKLPLPPWPDCVPRLEQEAAQL